MQSEGLRAAIDRITHQALPNVGETATTKGRARAQVEIAEGVLSLIDGMGERGYVEVFYEIASIAGLGTAQTISPRVVWETQLRPKLEEVFDRTTPAAAADRAASSDYVIRRLQAALRVCRGWVIMCSESAQARRDLKTLDDALALRPADQGEGWRTMESAPRDETSVDLWVADGGDSWRVVNAWWCPDQKAWIVSSDFFDECVKVEVEGTIATHWMPIPAAPALDRKGNAT